MYSFEFDLLSGLVVAGVLFTELNCSKFQTPGELCAVLLPLFLFVSDFVSGMLVGFCPLFGDLLACALPRSGVYASTALI